MAGSDQQSTESRPELVSAAHLGVQMAQEHQRLQRSFEALIESLRGGDWAASNRGWAEFEQKMLAHMECEEQFMVPWIEQDDPFEAAAILDEHRRLREQLAELGLQLELHSVREDHVQRLFDLHRHHAAREERILYQCSDRALPPESARSLLARISNHISNAFFF